METLVLKDAKVSPVLPLTRVLLDKMVDKVAKVSREYMDAKDVKVFLVLPPIRVVLVLKVLLVPLVLQDLPVPLLV